jgi:hypothetical protein
MWCGHLRVEAPKGEIFPIIDTLNRTLVSIDI